MSTIRKTGKANKTGRSDASGGEHWTKMIRPTMETPAWRALSLCAQSLYVWLKLEWRGPNANNNGKISLSVRQAAELIGVRPDTAAKAFHDLQAKGFLVLTQYGTLGSTGEAKAPTYEITEIAMPSGPNRGGRNLFSEWQEGKDFPVQKMRPNNPQGINRKSESHLEARDCADTKIVTFRGKQT